jgi:hypothetical protein
MKINRIYLALIAVVLTLACFSVVSAAETPIGGNQGWITVNCNVNGAQVYFDGTSEGMISGGVLTVPVYSTGTPLKFIYGKQNRLHHVHRFYPGHAR